MSRFRLLLPSSPASVVILLPSLLLLSVAVRANHVGESIGDLSWLERRNPPIRPPAATGRAAQALVNALGFAELVEAYKRRVDSHRMERACAFGIDHETFHHAPMNDLPPVTLGPLMLPPGLWLSLLMLTAATVVWRRQLAKGSSQPVADDTPLVLAGLGMLGARIGFVGLYWREYLESPWSVINIRDGGWWWPAGVAAIALGASLLGWRRPPLRRPLILASTAAAAIGALAVVVASALTSAAQPRLPTLQVASLAGEPLPLHDGRASVINLWASWCPPCRREMPVLVEGARRYPNMRFLLINQGEEAATVEAVGGRWKIPAALLAVDVESRVSTTLGVRGYPTTMIVAADGRILGRHTGEVSSASLAALIERIDSGN